MRFLLEEFKWDFDIFETIFGGILKEKRKIEEEKYEFDARKSKNVLRCNG